MFYSKQAAKLGHFSHVVLSLESMIEKKKELCKLPPLPRKVAEVMHVSGMSYMEA